MPRTVVGVSLSLAALLLGCLGDVDGQPSRTAVTADLPLIPAVPMESVRGVQQPGLPSNATGANIVGGGVSLRAPAPQQAAPDPQAKSAALRSAAMELKKIDLSELFTEAGLTPSDSFELTQRSGPQVLMSTGGAI